MDGNIKQFVFPDRRNGNLYVATDTRVTQWKDTPGLTSVYSWNVASPSAVLYRPNTDFLYVGSSDGQLYQLNVADHTTRSVLLDGSQVGAPSLDGPNNLVLVGSANGVVYAVRADPTTGIPWP
jgi:hypothetical protein